MAQLDRSLIAGSPTFANLSPAALDEILSHASTLRVPKGEAAFRQGEAAERFFLLLHGRLRVTRLNPQGQQMVVRFVSPGDMFGVAMAIRVDAYPGTATAAVDLLALAWPNSVWADLLARFPGLAVNTMQALVAACRICRSASSINRLSRSNSASPSPCCNWRSRRDARPKTAC